MSEIRQNKATSPVKHLVAFARNAQHLTKLAERTRAPRLKLGS